MRFIEDLYWSDGFHFRKRRLKRLEKHKFRPDIYLIYLNSEAPKPQLEIINSMFLLQPYYANEDLLVCGIAKSKDDAIDLVCRMTEDMLSEDGGSDLAAFVVKERN